MTRTSLLRSPSIVIDFWTAPLHAVFDLGVENWVARDWTSPNATMDMFAERIYLMDGYYSHLLSARVGSRRRRHLLSRFTLDLSGTLLREYCFFP